MQFAEAADAGIRQTGKEGRGLRSLLSTSAHVSPPPLTLLQDGSSSSGPRSLRAEERDPKDRTREIPVELSMRYLESPAYRETYGDSKIWELYRRNFHKGKTWRPTRRSW